MNARRRGVNIRATLVVMAGLLASSAVAQERPGYLVAPFVQRKGGKALAPYVASLGGLLAEKLSADARLRFLGGPSLLPDREPPISDAELGELARAAGARFVLAGGFERLPDWTFRIDERLLDVSGTEVREVARGERGSSRAELQENTVALGRSLFEKAGLVLALPPGLRMTNDAYAFYLYGRALAHIHGYGGASRDPKLIEKLLRRIVAVDPRFVEAHRIAGWWYAQQDELKKARAAYRRAIELRKDDYAALLGSARLAQAMGERARALDEASRALALRPSETEARFLRGKILCDESRFDEAMPDLQQVIREVPRHLEARRQLALVHAMRGDTASLVRTLEGLTALAPEDVTAWLDLGAAYVRMNQPDKALAAYQAVLTAQPKHLLATKFSADLWRRRGDYEKAAELYRNAMKIAPADPRPYFLLGATFVQAGNDSKAEEVFQQAQQFKRYLPEAWNNLGTISYRRGDLSSALWYLERAVEKMPRRPKVRYNFALALSAAKRSDRALDELRRAATLDPSDPEIPYTIGVLFLRLGKFDEASKEFRETLALKPDHPNALTNLTILEQLQRRTSETEIRSPHLGGETRPAVAPSK